MEGNNYGFKFDPNKIEKSFDNGSKLSIENDGGELNMSPDRRYVTALPHWILHYRHLCNHIFGQHYAFETEKYSK